jgi:enolase-phosphatase E1
MSRAVLVDIEGTTTPIRFVTEVLYPYARERLPAFVRERAADAEIAKIIAEVRLEAGRDLDLEGVIAQLLAWMDADRKIAPLKDLQGLIWEQGYADGELVTEIYEDAARGLRAWHAAGLRLYVYSSGSVQAQQAIFAHTDHGDVGALFSAYFDTRVGNKREADSYRLIAEAIGLPPDEILFLSDVREELDAARAAGLHTAWLVRDAMPSGPAAAHRRVRSFDALRP